MLWSVLAFFPTPVIYSMSLYIKYASRIDVVHVVRLEFVFMMHLRQIVESILKFTCLKFMPLARLVGSGRRTCGEGSILNRVQPVCPCHLSFTPLLGKFQVELNCTLLKYEIKYYRFQWSAMLCGLQQVLMFPFVFVTWHETYGESRGKYLTHRGAADCCSNIHKPLWSSSIHFLDSCSHRSDTNRSLQ
jgi:hypothetical protein